MVFYGIKWRRVAHILLVSWLIAMLRRSASVFRSTLLCSTSWKSPFCSSIPKTWKICFFGTDEISLPTIRALHAHKDLVTEISIVCPPDKVKKCEVKQFAEMEKIPFYQPDRSELASFSIQTKTGGSFDLGIVASYGNLIPTTLIESFTHGGLNMHPSFLPFYKGPAPLIRQIERGDKVTAVSLLEISPNKFDEGKIFLQWLFSLPEDILCREFDLNIAQHGARAVIHFLSNFQSLSATKKEHADPLLPMRSSHPLPLEFTSELTSLFGPLSNNPLSPIAMEKEIQATESIFPAKKRIKKTRKLRPDEGIIDWASCSAIQVYNKWRAFGKKPGCYNFMKWPAKSNRQKRVKFIIFSNPNSLPVAAPPSVGVPGSIRYSKETDSLFIQCNGGVIECTMIQMAGKKAVDGNFFHNGHLATFPDNTTIFQTEEIINKP